MLSITAIRRCIRNDSGVSAIEFALFAPILIFGLLATVDVGLAISERMTMGHILRAGAQGATGHIDAPAVLQIMRTTAASNIAVADAGADGDDRLLALKVERLCTCPGQPAVAVDCSTTCSENAPTQIFFALSGTKTYSGLILPRFALSQTLQVQVR